MTAPNIILIIADDMVYSLLAQMPSTFRSLALTGVFFSKCYVTTPLCQPARATFITGQYPHNHGIITNATPYTNLDQTTCMGSRLQAAGYQTCHVGKYLNSYLVTDGVPTGWNEWHAISPSTFYSYSINDNGVVTAVGTAPTDYNTTVCTNRATTFIASATQPFFMQVGYKPSHFDVTEFAGTPAPEYSGCIPSSRVFSGTTFPNYNPTSLPGKPAYVTAQSVMLSSTIDQVNAFWRSEIEMLFSLDRAVADIITALTTAGKLSNTYIIFVSDNGYMHGEFRIPGQKFVPYESSIHVPLIISGPSASVSQNKYCSSLVSQVDILPTIYALAGASTSRTMDGASLVPLLQNQQATVRTNLIVEWLGTSSDDPQSHTPTFTALRSDGMKYTDYTQTNEFELFNLNADPFEMTNLYGNANYAAIQAEMASLLATAQTCTGTACLI